MCRVGTGKCLTSGPLNCVLPHGVKSAGRQCPVIRCQELANDRFESKEPHLLFGDFFFTHGVFPNACRHPSLACGGTQAYLGARMIKTVIARLAPASQPGQFMRWTPASGARRVLPRAGTPLRECRRYTRAAASHSPARRRCAMRLGDAWKTDDLPLFILVGKGDAQRLFFAALVRSAIQP